jgi:NAD(P)-dependent dehydrogenase (short-subunit alcohol dehydrogenase family)
MHGNVQTVASAEVVVVTGAAGGIGSALRERLVAAGCRVIGIDRVDSDIVLDVGDRDARRGITSAVETALNGDTLVGVVAAAGVLGMGEPGDAAQLAQEAVSVNYFGAIATLEALRPLLARSGRGAAVAVGSHMATTQPTSADLVERCLDDAEVEARVVAATEPAAAYASTKLALEQWVRRRAPGADWIGAGITLNAVALGLVDTPMTTAHVPFLLANPDVMPLPVGRAATPAEAAGAIAFLLSDDARFCCGSILSMDGGVEAVVRGREWPARLDDRPID